MASSITFSRQTLMASAGILQLPRQKHAVYFLPVLLMDPWLVSEAQVVTLRNLMP